MNDDQVVQVLATMGAAWPQWEPPPPTIQLYVEVLQPYEFPTAVEAIGKLIRTCKWAPSLAELVEALQAERRASEPVVRALPEGSGRVLTQAEAAPHIAEIRRIIREARARHRGDPGHISGSFGGGR